MGPCEFSTSLDEIRSRAYFLRLLGREEAVDFADRSIAGLEELLAGCEATIRLYVDPFSRLAMLGAIRETEARIAWMKELREAFSSEEFWSQTV
jgi:hypothetical protein